MRLISYILILLIIIVGVTFAILNASPVAINYYFGIQHVPLSLLLVISFGLGLLLSFVVMSFIVLRLKNQKWRLRKQLKIAEQEIDNLRSLPVKDEH